jgi:AraC family transcriptional regulator
MPSPAGARASPDRLRIERPTCTVAVTDYAPLQRLAAHAHAEAWVSFVLSGGFIEEARGARGAVAAGDILVKPAETRHANEFGAQGACILSIRCALPHAAAAGSGAGGYGRHRDPRQFGAAVALALNAAAPGEGFGFEERALVLAGDASDGAGAAEPRRAPAWLGRVVERLADDPLLSSLAPLAELAEVHPVHLARVFRRATGLTLRAFRRRLRVQRAIDLLAAGGRLAEVAQRAGFADEPHLCRSLRLELGTTPRTLARVLREGGARRSPG